MPALRLQKFLSGGILVDGLLVGIPDLESCEFKWTQLEFQWLSEVEDRANGKHPDRFLTQQFLWKSLISEADGFNGLWTLGVQGSCVVFWVPVKISNSALTTEQGNYFTCHYRPLRVSGKQLFWRKQMFFVLSRFIKKSFGKHRFEKVTWTLWRTKLTQMVVQSCLCVNPFRRHYIQLSLYIIRSTWPSMTAVDSLCCRRGISWHSRL